MSELLEHALQYAAKGWAVFPLSGKFPIKDKSLHLENGFQDATTHPDTIRGWWAKYPAANIGIPTGYHFWVLDVDTKHGGPEVLEALELAHTKLPDTLQATTGSGGRHFLFRQPATNRVGNSVSKIGPGLDTRGDGGYIVAAPSIHPETGAAYVWDGLDEWNDQPILEAPEWLLAKINGTPDEKKEPFVLPEVVPEGQRDITIFRAASKLRRLDFGQSEILAAIRPINEARCKPPLPEKDLERIARSASRYPSGDIGKPDVLRKAFMEYKQEGGEAGAGTEPGGADELDLFDSESPNHLARVIMQGRAFLSHAKYLYEYNGSHWLEIEETHIRNLAASMDKVKETTTSRRNQVVDYINDVCYRREIPWNSIATSEVPFLDGVYDIETGARRAHRQEDYLQTVIPHNTPTGAEPACTAFLACLDRYFRGDADSGAKVAAIQEFFGYCLMAGHARYKKALLLTGDTDCGKSTIPMAIGWMVGLGNCCSISIEDMDDQKRLAPILGKLVNRMGELKSRAAVADGGFKKLVSTGDSVSVEKKFKDTIEYTPVAKHVIATNNLPTVNDHSKATFNRMLLIRFNHSIPKSEQTTDVYDHIQAQLPGLVAWALEGARRLYRNQGKFTKIPESEYELTEYRKKENVLIEFLEDFCIADEKCSIPRHTFQEQLKIHGIDKYKGPTALSRDLGSIGIKVEPRRHQHIGVVRSVIGYRMRKVDEEPTQFVMSEVMGRKA